MAEIVSKISNSIMWMLVIALYVGIIIRIVREVCSKTVECQAVVINKQSYEPTRVSRYPVGAPHREYVVTFLCDNKKLHFNVSEFSYNGYHINQKGTLKYKGSRLIGFKD